MKGKIAEFIKNYQIYTYQKSFQKVFKKNKYQSRQNNNNEAQEEQIVWSNHSNYI